MKWPLVSRTRHDQVEAERRRLAGQYGHLHETWADTAIVNDCLTDANLAVARRLTRALRACARYRAALATEKRRADRLQRRLYDAMGLNTAPVQDGRLWQQTRHDKKGITS